MIEIQMASWQSICKRLRSKHFSLCLCTPCQARQTEIKSQRDKRPNNKQSVAHCAVVNSNEAMATRLVSHTQRVRHTSQPSRPLAVAKSRSPHGSAAAVCLWGEFELGVVWQLWAECNVCVRLHLPWKRRAFLVLLHCHVAAIEFTAAAKHATFCGPATDTCHTALICRPCVSVVHMRNHSDRLTQPQSFHGFLRGEGKTLDEWRKIFPVPAVEEIFSIRHKFSTFPKQKGKRKVENW